MDEKKRLVTVLEHWVEHNESHLEDYRKWGESASRLGLESVGSEIEAAASKLAQSNDHLRRALKSVGSI